MDWGAILGFCGAFGVACAATGALPGLLARYAVIDLPNERSSHVAPTPRGGGIAVAGAIALVWLIAAPPDHMPILFLGLALGLTGWWDDVKGLPAALRLALQIAAVALGFMIVDIGPVFQGLLPPALDRAVAALAWIWFVNLFNFMDGIDGIAGIEAAAIGLGLAIVAMLAENSWPSLPAASVAGAALGFLVWNWPPARIFLGDVGSQSLGYLLGFLLLRAAAEGHWAVAFVLPLYFVADATVTLLRRLARREAVWRAHRSHFYQRAVQALGGAHRPVLLRVLALDLGLLALAAIAAFAPDTAIIVTGAAILATGGLLYRFESSAKEGGHDF